MARCSKCSKQSSVFKLDLFTHECAECRKIPAEPLVPEKVLRLTEISNMPVDIRSIGSFLMVGGIFIALYFSFIHGTSLDFDYIRENYIGNISTSVNATMVSMGIAIIGSILYVGGRIEAKNEAGKLTATERP